VNILLQAAKYGFAKRNTYLDYKTFADVIGTYVCLVTILDNFLAVVVKKN
jgi:hypothetical protein